jgi:hypothetical protein
MTDTQTFSAPEQQILASWQAPVIPKHDRTKRWYTIGGAVVLLCSVYGIISGSWPFTIVALLCGAMYYLMRDHVPPLKTITITDGGVFLEEIFTRWEDLTGFWMMQTRDYTELHFIPKMKRRSDIMIQTGNQNISDLRVLIGSHIPELTDKQESFLDALIRTAKL